MHSAVKMRTFDVFKSFQDQANTDAPQHLSLVQSPASQVQPATSQQAVYSTTPLGILQPINAQPSNGLEQPAENQKGRKRNMDETSDPPEQATGIQFINFRDYFALLRK